MGPRRRPRDGRLNRIDDYALVGDCHSAALVGRDGSVDWACFPRFDSPAVFCRLLDEERGGFFLLAPDGVRRVARRYLDDTNVLVTTFTAGEGTLEVTDCMPVAAGTEGGTAVVARQSILRRARCTGGRVRARLVVAPRFEYGAFVPRFRLHGPLEAEIVGGSDALAVRSTAPLSAEAEHLEATWSLAEGEEAWVEAAWFQSHAPMPAAADFDRLLADTVSFWRAWLGRCWYDGDHAPAVRRSALVLKALTYAPSGAVVAAPTTSLPEWVGGARNWDYRYVWIRDATLTLTSLFVLGFDQEANAFKRWLERTGAGRPQDLQIMYGICGERSLPEMELPHLAGYADSRPVRIGNGAVKQLQLDSYGQILEAAWLYAKAGGELTDDNWGFVAGLADIVCQRWQKPDQGIWEVRDEPRHFVHSKLNCWLALDRALRLADALGVPAPVARWTHERDRLRDYLLDDACPDGWFPQAVGHNVPDAAALLVPAFGLLPTTDPRVTHTVDVVRRALEQDGLLFRYLAPDGLEGGEGAFVLCSFWLLDCLTHAGRLTEAGELLERLLGLANDVGLYPEQLHPTTGEALGNFPQAFSHMALVLSCAHLSAARRGQIPDGAHDYADLAVGRLLAARSERSGGSRPHTGGNPPDLA